MIFPIGDDNVKGGARPVFTYSFLVLNVVLFIMTATDPQRYSDLFAANPCRISDGQSLYTIITSMFMHGGFWHLAGNMLFLWIFADNIESTIGNIRFLLFYVIGGVIAVYAHIIIGAGSGCIPLVGASGAIAAVMGAYLVMFPKSRIKMIFLIKVFRIPAFIFLGFWIVQQLMSGFSSLPVVKDMDGGGVAFWAHIGGFVFGVLAGFFFKNRYPKINVLPGDPNLDQPEYHSVEIPPKRFNNRF